MDKNFMNINTLLGFDIAVEARIKKVNASGTFEMGFRIRTVKEGKRSNPVDVNSLENIDYFSIFGVSVPYLTTKKAKQLLSELQRRAEEAPLIEETYLSQGFHFVKGEPVYIYGSNVIGNPEIDVKISNPLLLKRHTGKPYALRDVILTIPGFSEILFFQGRLAILKPILKSLGMPVPDYILGVFASSRKMKTAEAMKRCLNLSDTGIQMVDIMRSDLTRRTGLSKDIKSKMLKLLQGHTILLDDFRRQNNSFAFNKAKDRIDSIARIVNSEPDCACVVLTGEFVVMNELGIYSLKDRFLNVVIPDGTGEELQRRKDRNDELCIDTFADIDMALIANIIDRFEDFKAETVKFFDEKFPSLSADRETGSRTRRHAAFIRYSEMVFRKFYCDNDAKESCLSELEEALNRVVESQLQRLKKDALLEDYDYVELVKMVIDKGYIYLETDPKEYFPEDGKAFRDSDYIYVTSETLMEGLRSFLRRTDIRLKDVTKALKEAGIVNKESRIAKKTCNASKHWWVNIALLKKYCEQKVIP